MVKKIIIVILVIVSGLMLGVILSGSLSNNKPGGIQSLQTGDSRNTNAGLEVQLTASPAAIKAAGKLDPVSELAKIDRSNLRVSYANKTSSNLSGVELWLITEGGNSTGVITMSEATKYDNTKSKNNMTVFKLADLPKNSSNKVTVGFFVRPAGDTIVKAEIRTKEGKSGVSEGKIIKSK